MCTLSWTRKKSSEGTGSYALFFNRDEQRTRPSAVPPKIHEGRSRNWISATDPVGGGTWLACNDSGLSVALLNSYESPECQSYRSAEEYRSRGLLVRDIVEHCANTSSAMDWLDQIGKELAYRPFYLSFFDLEMECFRHWSGSSLETMEPEGFLSSSSFQPEKVIPIRASYFSSSKDLECFHRQHDPDETASSVLMARPDAATVSLSKIHVSSNSGINYQYAEDPDWTWQNPVLLPFSLS